MENKEFILKNISQLVTCSLLVKNPVSYPVKEEDLGT